jgi:hypothetical protein
LDPSHCASPGAVVQRKLTQRVGCLVPIECSGQEYSDSRRFQRSHGSMNSNRIIPDDSRIFKQAGGDIDEATLKEREKLSLAPVAEHIWDVS